MPHIEIDARRIEFQEIEGDRDKDTLVFLHEGLGSLELWRRFPERIVHATGRRALVYSRFGHGHSDARPEPRTPQFMHDEALHVLPRLLDRLDVGESLLVGHSDGASIALIHAGARIRPVAGVVAMAPHVSVEEANLEAIREMAATFQTTDLADRMARYHTDPAVTFHGWAETWLSPEFRGWNIERSLTSLTCPVLVIQGEDDRYGSVAQLEAIERRVRGRVERLILAGCGHAPHLERPRETSDAIRRFVADLR
jgi:pimeloyl-ACP methyl ester carboxylesterase